MDWIVDIERLDIQSFFINIWQQVYNVTFSKKRKEWLFVNNTQLEKTLLTIKNYVDTTTMNHFVHTAVVDVNTLKTTGIYSLTSNCTNNATTNAGTLIVDFNVGTPYQLFGFQIIHIRSIKEIGIKQILYGNHGPIKLQEILLVMLMVMRLLLLN